MGGMVGESLRLSPGTGANESVKFNADIFRNITHSRVWGRK